MRPADLARLAALGALWGASYLFMRLAVPHVGAEWVVEGRTLAGGLVLAAFIVLTGRGFALRRHWRGYLVVGLVGVALPFWLIGTAVKTIDASTAAILNTTSPIFSAIVASIWIRDRLTVEKMAGIALSIVGIAILLGWTPKPMSAAELFACALSLVACACYGWVERLHQSPPEGRALERAFRGELPHRGGCARSLHAVDGGGRARSRSSRGSPCSRLGSSARAWPSSSTTA